MKLLISTSARPKVGESGTKQKIQDSQKRNALAKKIVKGAGIVYLQRQYKAGGNPDKTGTLYRKYGKIKNVVLGKSGQITKIVIDIQGMDFPELTLTSFQKLLAAPMPKAGAKSSAMRFGTKPAVDKNAAIKAQIAKHEAAIVELKRKLKSQSSEVSVALSAAPKANTVTKLTKDGKTISVGDSWRLKLTEDDEYAQSTDTVGHEFNVVITNIYKNGEFNTIETVDGQVVENVYNMSYLLKKLHSSVLGK